MIACGSLISQSTLSGCSFVKGIPLSKTQSKAHRWEEQGKGKLFPPAGGRLSVHAENGSDELVFQAAFHVLVQAGVRTAAFVVDRPGAEFAYVALVVPQDLLHGIGVPSLGRIAHRQR